MSDTSPETPGQPDRLEAFRAQELQVEISNLAADALLRGGLPLDCRWSTIRFSQLQEDLDLRGEIEISSGIRGSGVNYRLPSDTLPKPRLMMHVYDGQEIQDYHSTTGLDRDYDLDMLTKLLPTLHGQSARIEVMVPES